jgi:hypothetical protein
MAAATRSAFQSVLQNRSKIGAEQTLLCRDASIGGNGRFVGGRHHSGDLAGQATAWLFDLSIRKIIIMIT